MHCALLALPLVSAVPLDILGNGKSSSGSLVPSVNDIVDGQGLTTPLTGDSITDLLKNGENLVSQVNEIIGNILPDKIGSKGLLDSTLGDIRKEIDEIETLFVTFAGLLQAAVANFAPTSIPDALKQLEDTIGNLKNTDSTIENIVQAIINGLSVTDLTQNVLAGYALSPINSYNNQNPRPNDAIYPQKQPGDAPYSVAEAQLRAALYIPPGFTYGRKRPILFVPGTGAFGGVNFISNLGKLLGNDDRFDPVYLNVPGAMYNDTQINSEYIAYGINYVSSITKNQDNLAVIAWSQGNLDTQWVLQYWPSTRPIVEDFISVSADFHGTTLAYFIDPAFPDVVPNPPSVIQQEYDSNFVQTLRNGGGFAPYVPSTSIWSITDEIVQPQYSPYASASYFAQDLPGTPNTDSNSVCPVDKNIPYTNAQIQTVCKDRPAGLFYPHEGVLYNPLAYALALDALTHDGPGRIDRIDLDEVCNQVVAPGLSLEDVLATEGLIPLAALNLLLYPGKVQDEPAVRQYALQANAAGNCDAPTGQPTGTATATNGWSEWKTSTTKAVPTKTGASEKSKSSKSW